VRYRCGISSDALLATFEQKVVKPALEEAQFRRQRLRYGGQ
jgi:hypothetical protein